jgi:hypothetical protein
MTFNIASNGGLTIMAVVRFTGEPGAHERIIDFANGADNDNIILKHDWSGTTLGFSIRNGDTTVFAITGGVVPQNTWLTIHAMYHHETQSVELWVNGVRVAAETCNVDTDIDYARACGAQQDTACPAAQTSDYSSTVGLANNALDNDLNSITHTSDMDTTPCWRVDLEKTVLVQALTLEGRHDGYEQRNDLFAVYVGQADDMEDMTKHEVCVFNQDYLPLTGNKYVECERPLYGRYVYFYLPNNDHYIISLADVKVWGTRSATDRTVTGTYIGKSHWPNDAYFSGDLAALEVVDAYRGIGANLAPGCAACAAGEYGLALQAAGGTQVIVGYQDVPRNWDEVHAFVVAKGGSLLTAQEMIAWLAEHGAVAIDSQWAPVYNPDLASPHKDWIQVGLDTTTNREIGTLRSAIVPSNPNDLTGYIDAIDDQKSWNYYYIWKLDASPGVCTMEAVTGDRGWRRVRHLPATSTTWHPATDDLAGTDTYGDPDDDSIAWSVPFGAFDQFLFATGDGRHWLVATREAVNGENYDNTPRDVIKSSVSPIAYTAVWYNRVAHAPPDPWITTQDHTASSTIFLYGEASEPETNSRLQIGSQQHGGLNVFVRDAGPNMEAVTGEKGWRRVRHLPATSTTWHPATDDLAGTDTYGDPNDDSTAWSVPFGAFDQFLFATGDGRHWLMATTEAVNGENYENAPRDVIKSSYNSIVHTANWYNRGSNQEDPIIKTQADVVLYRENNHVGNPNELDISAEHGIDVFVRLRDAGPTTSACAREYPACAACAAGTYSGSEGSTECAACPANSHSSAALTDCLCNAGYSGPDGGPYTACVAGSYKTSPGPGACTLCGEDTYSVSVAATASSVCLACPPDSTTESLTGNDNITRCYCDLGYISVPTPYAYITQVVAQGITNFCV